MIPRLGSLVAWALLVAVPVPPCAADEVAAPVPADAAVAFPSLIMLKPGELRSLAVSDISRVAVGNPSVMDLTIVSPTELLLQAKSIGKTNLIIWDQRGQHVATIEVMEESTDVVESQLRQVMAELSVPGVTITREGDKLFLMGEVSTDDEMNRLEQMLASFPTVTNLARTSNLPPEPPPPPPLVRLSVQVMELTRTDLEKLGVKWGETIGLTEPAVTNRTVNEALFRWGTAITRDQLSVTLNALVKRNRARILAEPKLVTASGKEASSFIGVEVPIVTATSFGTTTSTVSTSIEFRETGVLLKMTPTIHAEQNPKKISTVIQAEVSDVDSTVALSVPVGSQTVEVPGFKVSKANTQITTLSGQTIIIAGLLQLEENNNASQVPALGSMPVFGRLFRSPEISSEQKEIVIAVTPDLISDGGTSARAGALEEAVSSAAQIRAAGGDPALQYALQVQQAIAESLDYPERDDAAMASGRVKLRLQVFRDGTLGQAMVTQSSGVPAFDVEAIKAAQSRAPFQPFSPGITQQELWLEIPVEFNE